jgi:hypothetical protein
VGRPTTTAEVANHIIQFCKEQNGIVVGAVIADKLASGVLPQRGVRFEIVGPDPVTGNPKRVMLSRDKLQDYLDHHLEL